MAVYGGVKVNCRLEGAWQISGEMSITLIYDLIKKQNIMIFNNVFTKFINSKNVIL